MKQILSAIFALTLSLPAFAQKRTCQTIKQEFLEQQERLKFVQMSLIYGMTPEIKQDLEDIIDIANKLKTEARKKRCKY